MTIEELYKSLGYELVLTCGACPEQYDVLKDSEIVAYLRLRHGRFTVNVPDVGGKLLYETHPKGDGIFTDDERYKYLEGALLHIHNYYY